MWVSGRVPEQLGWKKVWAGLTFRRSKWTLTATWGRGGQDFPSQPLHCKTIPEGCALLPQPSPKSVGMPTKSVGMLSKPPRVCGHLAAPQSPPSLPTLVPTHSCQDGKILPSGASCEEEEEELYTGKLLRDSLPRQQHGARLTLVQS